MTPLAQKNRPNLLGTVDLGLVAARAAGGSAKS
jgi:hypothetical protein